MSSATIRPARLDDAPVLARLMTSLGYPSTDCEMQTRLGQLDKAGGYGALVAEIDEQVVGLIGLSLGLSLDQDGAHARIIALVVAEHCRGTGIGQVLLAAGEAWAHEHGADRLIVNSAHQREHAHHFYEAQGYRDTGLRFVKTLG
ncbi:GNAT family N-acetyltransferase [Jeongeupia naejangsanensis]|uniref:GNAT family N-acetyltransferase n=1 Tax=Jeongeupia naejangsanensis TaxID=613195 RepID=A0ABS2BLI3_9NEIS|nr:GNAT family N-acetyltransferase [Jeongeupia naejangsanensis]MBM3115943.1 GNAT family N-acetyltransferase [Jeongeupia naejangsanensis]